MKKKIEDLYLKPEDMIPGKTVFHIVLGEKKISRVTRGTEYCVTLEDHMLSFTIDGKQCTEHSRPTLYKSDPFEYLKPDDSDYPKKMYVSNGSSGPWNEEEVLAHLPERLYAYLTLDAGYKFAKDITPTTFSKSKLTLEERVRIIERKLNLL